MPVVPIYKRQTQLEQLPQNVRLTAGETPESQGALQAEGDAKIAGALAGVGAKTAAIGEQGFSEEIAKEKDRADNIALMNADTQLARWENERVYDPNKGALTIKGQAAFGLPEQLRDEFTTQADAIEAGLSTDRQKQAFRRVRTERGINLDGVIWKHTSAEIQQYQANELQASVDNSRNAAIANSDDPRRVGIEIAKQTNAIQTHAKWLGFGPEETAKQVTAARSATIVGVIENALAQDKTKAAQTYFDTLKGEISGEAIVRIEKALKEGSVRTEGQKQADAIIGAGGTLSEMREKAKGIQDAEVRDNVTQRIEHEWSVREAINRQDEENALKGAFNILDKTPDIHKIPPTAWVSFTGAQRGALMAYADKLSAGTPVETDYPTYYSLMTQAGKDPTTFANANLLNYRAKLGDTEFKQLTDIQLSIRNKDNAKADRDLGDFRTKDQIVTDSLIKFGITTDDSKLSTDQRRALAELRQLVDTRTTAQANLTGKKPTGQDIQSIVDQILSSSIDVKGSWWNIWPRSGPFFDQSKKFQDITPADIPGDERQQIEAALRRRGRPVNDTTVLDLYLDAHSRAK